MSKNNNVINRNIAIVSVFSGAGGLDLGFAQEGFRTIFAADYMPAAVSSFNHNAEGEVAVNVDLLKNSSTSVLNLIESRVESFGCIPRGLIGGPPCQGVSSANNASGPVDPRNKLFSRYINLVLKLDLRYHLDFFVFENVPGLKLKKNLKLYEKLISRLGKEFHIFETVVNAVDFGLPQTRRRLIIVGFTKRLHRPIFSFPKSLSREEYSTVRDAIEGLPEPSFFDRKRPKQENTFHPNHWTSARQSSKFGNELAYVPPKNARSFIRLDWDKPSRTVAYGNREVHLHPDGRRRLSILEAMRLQGFPDSFSLLGNFSEQVTQVSNAVPPPVARGIAKAIAKTLLR